MTIIDGEELYSTDLIGENQVQHNLNEAIETRFGALFNPQATRLLYVDSGDGSEASRVCIERVNGSDRICPLTLASADLGSVMYLPSGHIVILSGSDSELHPVKMQIFQPDAAYELVAEEREFDLIFVTGRNLKFTDFQDELVSQSRLWRLAVGQEVRWVVVKGNELRQYTAGTTLTGPTELGRLTPDAQDALRSLDVLSGLLLGALSPDGTKLVVFEPSEEYSYIREAEGILHLADLTADAVSFEALASGIFGDMTAAFSPDSSALAYGVLEGDGKGSIWIINSDGTNKRKLVDNAKLIDWR